MYIHLRKIRSAMMTSNHACPPLRPLLRPPRRPPDAPRSSTPPSQRAPRPPCPLPPPNLLTSSAQSLDARGWGPHQSLTELIYRIPKWHRKSSNQTQVTRHWTAIQNCLYRQTSKNKQALKFLPHKRMDTIEG
jgi:hypothetical protein